MSVLKRAYKKITGKKVSYIEELKSRGMRVGKNVDIINCKIDGTFPHLITIGDNVTLTNVRVLTHDASTKKFLGYSKIGRVTIGDNVFVGADTVILPGTAIGSNVVIGAGSVVAKNIPDNSVAFGNPVRVVCTFDEYIDKQRNLMNSGKVYDKLWSEKTPQEIEQQCKDIGNCEIAFDL